MKTYRMAAVALACAGALAPALTAPALGIDGEAAEFGKTYKGSKLSLKVAKKFIQPYVYNRVIGRCVNSETGELNRSPYGSFSIRKFKGKPPKIGVKSVRKFHDDFKDERGVPFTSDETLTVKFSSARKGKVTIVNKTRGVRKGSSEDCTWKIKNTVKRK